MLVMGFLDQPTVSGTPICLLWGLPSGGLEEQGRHAESRRLESLWRRGWYSLPRAAESDSLPEWGQRRSCL